MRLNIKRRIFLFAGLLSVLNFAGHAQQKDYNAEMKSLQQNIHSYFFIPGSGYYKENAVPKKDERRVSYLWPLCALLQAHNEMAVVSDDSALLSQTFKIIKRYHNQLPPAPGFASYSMQFGGGRRFYDDNQWIGITAMDAYAKNKDPRWLATGKEIYRFMMTGYDTTTGGGLYWEEGDKKTKNTCSNGPGIILALQLYKATNDKNYLDTALLLYNWVNQTLKAPSGLYYDNIKTNSNKIDKRVYAYNTGTMLQSAIYLFECTNNPVYLQQATNIADSSLPFFYGNKKFKDNYWFEAVLLRGYQHLLKYNTGRKYINAFKVCLDNALANEKNDHGLMGKNETQNLVAQGGMLEILARFAWLQKRNFFL